MHVAGQKAQFVVSGRFDTGTIRGPPQASVQAISTFVDDLAATTYDE
jgi:hypothetical protein